MKKSTVLAIFVSLMIAVPVGLVTAAVTPEEVIIHERRCVISADILVHVELGYYYNHELYHYEMRLVSHYDYDDEEWYSVWENVKVHDGWEERERTVATFFRSETLDYWINRDKMFLRCNGEETPRFNVAWEQVYVKAVGGVEITIDNGVTEPVTYQLNPSVLGVLIGCAIFPIGGFFFKGPAESYFFKRELDAIEKRRLEEQELMKRELRDGYREY